MSSGAAVILQPLTGERTIAAEYSFQCAPLEEFAVDVAYEHTDFMTVGAGEFSRPLGNKLRTVSFDTMIVPGQPSWAQLDGDVPALTESLLKICRDGLPFSLRVVDLPSDDVLLFMPATLRTLRLSDKAGEPGTKYVTVAFTEYRAPVLGDDGQDARPGKGTANRVPNKIWLQYTKQKKWKVRVDKPVPGLPKGNKKDPMTLRNLAQAFYNDADRWKDIRRANKKVGEKWGGSAPLEKSRLFKDNKEHRLDIKDFKRGSGGTPSASAVTGGVEAPDE